MVQCKLEKVEDLNAVVPKGAQQLSSQGLNEHVSDAGCGTVDKSSCTWCLYEQCVLQECVLGRERLLPSERCWRLVQCCCLETS